MAFLLLTFLACGSVVVGAGVVLGRSADVIAEAAGFGNVWTGAALLAAATSLPELVTDISAVRLRTPNLAAGDLFGSSLTNMLILAIVTLASRERAPKRLAPSNILTVWLAATLSALGALFVLVHTGWAFLGLRPESTLLLVLYLAGLRTIYRHAPSESPAANNGGSHGLQRAAVEFAFGAALIFATAPSFAWSARQLADVTGLGASFVGTCLVGLATALPELVTSLTAVRIGSFDLAVATLYGSSACNMAIFFALDLASRRGSIFAALEPIHALSGFLATSLMMLGLVTVARPRVSRRFALVEPGSGLMVVSYALALWLVHVYAQ
jgi:cation:H+ antiporter